MRKELWKRFIDRSDWGEAEKCFPIEPWRFYVKPIGEFYEKEWEYFKVAVQWIECLPPICIDTILKINSLVTHGTLNHFSSAIRNNEPIFNIRHKNEIQAVFEGGGLFYKNSDGLKISVEGFWPRNRRSLELFQVCRKISRSQSSFDHRTATIAVTNLKSILYQKVSDISEEWCIYFKINRQELESQLESIVQWHEQREQMILREHVKGTPAFTNAIQSHAMKLQRYLDVTQFCRDGSGRTSRLVADLVCLRNAVSVNHPIDVFYNGRHYPNLTFVPTSYANV